MTTPRAGLAGSQGVTAGWIGNIASLRATLPGTPSERVVRTLWLGPVADTVHSS